MRLPENSPIKHFVALNYSKFFSQAPPDDPFDFLSQYPTDTILMRISKINAIIYLQEDTVIQNMRILREVIFDGLPEVKEITVQLGAMIGQTRQCAFSGPIMSLIIKDALDHYVPFNVNQSVDMKTFAADLFKAILAYNERFYDCIGKDQLETFEGLFLMDIQQQYYLRRERYVKLTTLLKFAFLSKFLSEDEKLKGPALEYCKALQIGTVWGLASFFLFHIIELVLKGGKEARHILERNGNHWPVLEQFVMRKDDLTTEKPLSLHREIIPKPFYEMDDKRLLILDNNYFTYGMDQGVLFSLFNKTSLRNGDTFKNYNAYKSYFGLHYFEQYFTGRFIKTIFCKWNNYVVSSEKYQDYIVRAGNNIFVFEVKMTDFNAYGLDNKSFDKFQEFIHQNFLGAKKGLGQVSRQIDHLANDITLKELLNIKDTQRLNVFPIIVYSDANLDLNGVNEYVNQKQPEGLTRFKDKFQDIRPVIMISGSFFMSYYYLLRKDPTIFGKWLNDYLKSVSQLKKRYRSDKVPFDYLQYNRSFAEHMRRKIPNDDFSSNLTALAADFDLEIKDFGKEVS